MNASWSSAASADRTLNKRARPRSTQESLFEPVFVVAAIAVWFLDRAFCLGLAGLVHLPFVDLSTEYGNQRHFGFTPRADRPAESGYGLRDRARDRPILVSVFFGSPRRRELKGLWRELCRGNSSEPREGIFDHQGA